MRGAIYVNIPPVTFNLNRFFPGIFRDGSPNNFFLKLRSTENEGEWALTQTPNKTGCVHRVRSKNVHFHIHKVSMCVHSDDFETAMTRRPFINRREQTKVKNMNPAKMKLYFS